MIYVDSLICTPFEMDHPDQRPALEQLRAGGIGCFVSTLAWWEDAAETMDKLVKWRYMAEDNSDLVEIAYTVADVRRIAASGRTAILLGSQNVSFLSGRLGFVELFARMGMRVGQLTYNIQSDIGGSCYEPTDSGLSRFGKAVVREMNRAGMVVDLSHVGNQTSIDAIEYSDTPVAITHSNPYSLAPHARNKPDAVLDALKANDGMLGLAVYHNIVGEYSTPQKWSEMVAWTVDRVGVDKVGIGTDFDQTGGVPYLTWMRQGRWAREKQYGAGSPDSPGKAPKLDWIASPADFPNIEKALRDRGFAQDEVVAIMGENWLSFFDRTFRTL
ncbi:dipeptidase [Pedococcus sp. 5OH_020]|uniref:dipeptidase n=1 Tax=Pedococcus sp. 5OH_020 TaxID=2989814 RepID=UPI0022EA0058|nr:membrane dipeptidase [Pedococcus sp. 5OH_020]